MGGDIFDAFIIDNNTIILEKNPIDGGILLIFMTITILYKFLDKFSILFKKKLNWFLNFNRFTIKIVIKE